MKTAFVEYRNKPRPSDIVSFATDFDGLKFKRHGIDFYPNRSPFDVAEVYTLEYDSVILDLGVLVDENRITSYNVCYTKLLRNYWYGCNA